MNGVEAVKIAVIHPSINFCGGAEKVSLTMIDSLKRCGYHTSLITIDKTDWHRVGEVFGGYCKPNREFALIEEPYAVKAVEGIVKASTTGLRLLYFAYRSIEDFDIIVNTYGDLDLLNVLADLAYSGLPFSASAAYPETAPIMLRNRASQNLYKLLVKISTPIIAYRCFTILANSSFTKRALEKIYGSSIRVKILHPPCDVERYGRISDISGKGRIAVTISRFSPGKNLEAIPWIASRTDGWKFIIVGSTTHASQRILASLKEKIRVYSLEDRVELLPNAAKSTVEKILSEARVYIHLMRNEPFGISVVEAMAAGCIPIIHRSGGAWYDVLGCRQGYYGYGYESYSEIPRYMRAMEDDRLYVEISRRARERARIFDTRFFRERFIEEFTCIAELKYI